MHGVYIYSLINAICMNQKAKNEAAAVVDQLQGIESEVKAFHSMTQRMVLSQSEMVMLSSRFTLLFSKTSLYHSIINLIFRKKWYLNGVG